MNQDRRITDKLPTEKLDWTDTGANLAAAALAHLEAGKAAACLVRAKDDVWVGVGSKDALRGLLREFASQSQAVPSELASLQRYCIGPISMIGIDTGAWVKFADVQSLFSHSAATGRMPEEEILAAAQQRMWEALDRRACPGPWMQIASDAIFDFKKDSYGAALASPVAPLAGKAEPTAQGAAEPVAWAMPDGLERLARVRDGYADSPLLVVYAKEAGDYTEPLYRHIAAQAPAGRDAQQWISVDERLPEGRYCLAVYETPRGQQRIIRAMHVQKFTVEAQGDDCYSEINDENDTEYLREGWYELIDNWGEYSSVHVCEGVVTHWMPLPSTPHAAEQTEGRAK